jgi:hypothetical protein
MKGDTMSVQKVDPQSARQVIGIYGGPTAGKTRLATSLPERFGRVLYVAIDEGSEGLKSVLPHYQERIDAVRLTGEHPKLGILEDLRELATTDWESTVPPPWYPPEDAQRWKPFDTIILDTVSRLTYQILNIVSSPQMGMVSEKKDWGKIGDPDEPGFIQLAGKEHYGGLNTVMLNVITNIINMQPNLNIIFVCHEDPADDKSPVGRPGFAGRAVAKWLPTLCQDAVIRVTRREDTSVDGKGKVTKTVKRLAYFASHGSWMARRAENDIKPSEITHIELDIDPINFWTTFDNLNNRGANEA